MISNNLIRLGLVILTALLLTGCAGELGEEFWRTYYNCDSKIIHADGTVDYICRGSDTDLKYRK